MLNVNNKLNRLDLIASSNVIENLFILLFLFRFVSFILSRARSSCAFWFGFWSLFSFYMCSTQYMYILVDVRPAKSAPIAVTFFLFESIEKERKEKPNQMKTTAASSTRQNTHEKRRTTKAIIPQNLFVKLYNGTTVHCCSSI